MSRICKTIPLAPNPAFRVNTADAELADNGQGFLDPVQLFEDLHFLVLSSDSYRFILVEQVDIA